MFDLAWHCVVNRFCCGCLFYFHAFCVQEAGLLISRKAHGAHHKAPFEGNYCIVSGFWNGALDQQGSDQGFFRKLERFVAAKTGVEPRCWYEPKYEIEETPDANSQPRVSS